jgi:hypothetical protein
VGDGEEDAKWVRRRGEAEKSSMEERNVSYLGECVLGKEGGRGRKYAEVRRYDGGEKDGRREGSP